MNLKYLILAAFFAAFLTVSFGSDRFSVGSTYDIRQEFAQVICANPSDVYVNVSTAHLPIWERIQTGKKATIWAGGRFTVVSKDEGGYVLRYSFGPKHDGMRRILELPDGSLFRATEQELLGLLTTIVEKTQEEEKALAAELIRLSKEIDRPMTVEELLAYKL